MAASLLEATGEEAQLIRGAGGIFDVVCDERLLFSKQATGRFPEPEEILALLP